MNSITSIGEILFDIVRDEEKLGGAPFNFIYHVINLTGKGNFISRVGNDLFGKMILSFLESENISSDYIQVDEEHSTGVARAKMDVDKIPIWSIKSNTAYDFMELNKEITELIDKNTDCIYFGTLAQRMEKSRGTIHSLFNKKLKYFCDLNIRQDFYSKEIIKVSLNAANVVKLNLDELKLIYNLFIESSGFPFSLESAVNYLIKEFNIELLCVTMGEEGAALYNGNDSCLYRVKVNDDEIADTIGAGDAYAAILCIGYLNKWEIRKINRLACEFASEIVKIKGALPGDDLIYSEFRKEIKF